MRNHNHRETKENLTWQEPFKVVRRQEQPFADWWDELREAAGDRWAEVAEQAPTAFAAWACGASPEQAHCMVTAILPPKPAA